MADKDNHGERLERLMNHLAESALGLSDAAILAETSEDGTDPQREVERTRSVLQGASQALENVNKRLSILGHTIDSNYWWRGQWGHYNRCLDCGSLVSFTTATGEIQGEALDRPCPESGVYTIRAQEASRK
jgi:hypothetical protein